MGSKSNKLELWADPGSGRPDDKWAKAAKSAIGAAAAAITAGSSRVAQGGPLGAPVIVALLLAVLGRGVSSIVCRGGAFMNTNLRPRMNALTTVPWSLLVRKNIYNLSHV